MFETQLLKIRIRPGMTEKVVEFIRTLKEREADSLEALRREGMVVESLFLERREDADYLYYYVKARSLAYANEVNMRATDPFTEEIRRFIAATWGEIACPEPLLDLDLIPERPLRKRPRGAEAAKTKAASADPHVLAGG